MIFGCGEFEADVATSALFPGSKTSLARAILLKSEWRDREGGEKEREREEAAAGKDFCPFEKEGREQQGPASGARKLHLSYIWE